MDLQQLTIRPLGDVQLPKLMRHDPKVEIEPFSQQDRVRRGGPVVGAGLGQLLDIAERGVRADQIPRRISVCATSESTVG